MKKCLLLLMGFFLFARSNAQEDTTLKPALATLASFQLQAIDKVVQIKWSFGQREELKSFEVERSEDGLRFIKIGSRLAISKSANEDYDFVDATPKKDIPLHYRLKLISKDGFIAYSEAKELKPAAERFTVRLKQNPVRSSIDVEVAAVAPMQISVAVISQAGLSLASQSFQLIPGKNQFSLSAQTLSRGVYRLLVDAGAERKTISFIKE